MPRRLVIPAVAANRNAKTAPAVAIDSIDASDTDCLRNPAEFFSEINAHELDTLPAVALPFGVQDQVPSAVDVLVMLKAVFPPHPHELSTPTTDQEFQWLPIGGFKLHLRTLPQSRPKPPNKQTAVSRSTRSGLRL